MTDSSNTPPPHPVTPDGRYFVVDGQLWRCSNPDLDEETRQRLVNALMHARRGIKQARQDGDEEALAELRGRVHAAKVALGERGPTWWDDDTDFSRCQIENTPYAAWWQQREHS